MGSTPTGTAAAALAPNPPPRALAQDASSTPVKPTTAAAAGAGTGAGTGAGAGCAGAALPSRPPMSPPFVSPRRKTHAHLRARRTRLLSTARTPPAHAPPASGLLVPTPPLQAPPPADSTGWRVPARVAATPRTPVVVVAPRAQGTRLQRRLLRQAMAAMREALRGCAAVARASRSSRTGSATLLAALACPDARVAETAATCLLECTFEGTLRRLGWGQRGRGHGCYGRCTRKHVPHSLTRASAAVRVWCGVDRPTVPRGAADYQRHVHGGPAVPQSWLGADCGGGTGHDQ